jgi:hypothetical protein
MSSRILAGRVGAFAAVSALLVVLTTCGKSTNTSPTPGAVIAAARTITVRVATANRLNNAVESDATIAVTVGKVTVGSFKGDKNPWTYTVENVLTSTPFRIEAKDSPVDYSTNVCTGDLSADVSCTITLTDTLVAPSCNPQLLKYLYRPKRFEGLDDSAAPLPRCETTWGVVRGTEAEHDADAETWVQPTKQEVGRLFSAAHDNFNVSKMGLLVGEWICRGGLDDIGRSQGSTTQCDDYHHFVAQSGFIEVDLPKIGDSGVFVGSLVFDCGHNCWTELHPLVWWHKLLHPISPDLF